MVKAYDCSRHRIRFRGAFALLLAFCLSPYVPPRYAVAEDQTLLEYAKAPIDCSIIPVPSPGQVFRIPLRVHLGESGRGPSSFKDTLDEINDIWLSQAGICFEMQVVLDDTPLENGMDIWFLPVLPGGPGLNGYFRNDHNIQVRDTPILSPAPHPAHDPAARTAAHECGHGLSLLHRQDSDDNLMRSKTYGWHLNAFEIMEARKAAADKAIPDTTPQRCGEPRIVLPPQGMDTSGSTQDTTSN